MKIDCLSDCHGHYPQLEGGDLLIVAGDLTGSDEPYQYIQFALWLNQQKYRRKVLVGGNHDNKLQEWPTIFDDIDDFTYLCDSGTEFEGLKLWGSPWSKRFPGMNPKCMAFTVDTDEELAEKWALIPPDTDILITHCPAYGMLDKAIRGDHVGSKSLCNHIDWDAGLILHVFGHVHEAYGIYKESNPIFSSISVNASHVNESYWPVNRPIRIEL